MKPGDDYYQFTPRTLLDLKWFSMEMSCLHCHRTVPIDIQKWIRKLGEDCDYKKFRRRLKCSKCGQRFLWETFRRLPR